MKSILYILSFLLSFTAYSQSLPITFEGDVTTDGFVDFDGGVAEVVDNPLIDGVNGSAKVARIVRDGGAVFAGSKILLDDNLVFTTDNTISMKVYTTAPVGTVVKFKLEGIGTTERDVSTTVSGEWETLTWDFTAALADYNEVVFMFDFGNVGNGSEASTFYFDDVEQSFGGFQLDLPVTFEDADINYTTTDFGGNISEKVADPENSSNTVIKVVKPLGAATWAGTTIGTPAGFVTDIPLTLTESIMSVRVWSPDAGIPVRLKVEDDQIAEHTCETQTLTTIAGGWETIVFDFSNQATGTAELAVGLQMGWTFNMASIFFNFDTDGNTAGEKTYYFDEVRFGNFVVGTGGTEIDMSIYPNPASDMWTLEAAGQLIQTVQIFNSNGQLMKSMNTSAEIIRVDCEAFTAGIYHAIVQTNKGEGSFRLFKN